MVPEKERRFQKSVPSPITAGDSDTLHGHTQDLRIAAARSSAQKLVRNGTSGEAVIREVRVPKFVEKTLRDIRPPIKTRHGSVGFAAVLFEERNHPLVALTVRFRKRCATCVDVPVRIGTMAQQDFRHFMFSRPRTLIKRHAPRKVHAIVVFHSHSSVGIETEFQQELQHVGPIVIHGQPEQPAGEVRAKPLGVGVDPRSHDARNETAIELIEETLNDAERTLSDIAPEGYYVKIEE